MQITASHLEARSEAIEWLNGKRDFKAGLDILVKSGYKPILAAKLGRTGDTPFGVEKLTYELRSMLQLYASPNDPIHEDESEETILEGNVLAFTTGGDGDETETIKSARLRCAELWRSRGVLRNELMALGELNDETTVAARTALIQQIKECSDEIDTLMNSIDGKGNSSGKKDTKGPEVELTKEQLTTRKANLQCQLNRARNRLEYQQDNKLDTPNPMPEGSSRIKYEQKILRISAEIEQINVLLAKFA